MVFPSSELVDGNTDVQLTNGGDNREEFFGDAPRGITSGTNITSAEHRHGSPRQFLSLS
jgi:hypothetical protein